MHTAMPVSRQIFIFRSDRRFEDRQTHPGLDEIRIMDEILVGVPNFRPCERIVIDVRLLCDIPETIAILPPGSYRVGHIGGNHPMHHLHEVRGKCLDTLLMVWNEHQLIAARAPNLRFERIDPRLVIIQMRVDSFGEARQVPAHRGQFARDRH